jgi:ABC-type phosphate transport system substrate-binding protein
MFKRLLLLLVLMAVPMAALAADNDLKVEPSSESTVTGQGADLLQPGASQQLQSPNQQINQTGADNSLQSAGTRDQLMQYLEGEVDTELLASVRTADPEESRRYFWGLLAAVLAGITWLAYDYRRHVRY